VLVGVALLGVWACAAETPSPAQSPTTPTTPTTPGSPTTPVTRVDTVFASGFESLTAWDDRGEQARQRVVTMTGPRGASSSVLEVTFPAGADGGWLTKFFMPGFDSLYVQYWARFPASWRSGTKLISFYGARTDNQWSAAGKAGTCPVGNDFFVATVVQDRGGDPGPLRFYTYNVGMPREASPPNPPNTCYGDYGIGRATYTPAAFTFPKDRWVKVAYWVRLNTPGQGNGEQRLWVDDTLRAVWQNVTFRTDAILRLNAVTISNSISGGAPQTQLMWVDDLMVSRQRP
jgi:hypothetical protein